MVTGCGIRLVYSRQLQPLAGLQEESARLNYLGRRKDERAMLLRAPPE